MGSGVRIMMCPDGHLMGRMENGERRDGFRVKRSSHPTDIIAQWAFTGDLSSPYSVENTGNSEIHRKRENARA